MGNAATNGASSVTGGGHKHVGKIVYWAVNILGPLVFFLSLIHNPSETIDDRTLRICAMTAWMLIWWITEFVPLPVTSLLPIIVLPSFGIMSLKQVVTPYSSSVIFLFLGGFVIALALEKWNLHRRIALSILRVMGAKANKIILGFMLASAFLSMWISNTATAVMMLPIIISVTDMLAAKANVDKHKLHNLKIAMLLGMAFGANIGGMGTLIGTPPNAILAGYMSDIYQIQIGFLEWMLFALPIVVILLTVLFFLLTRVIYPNKLGRIESFKEIVSSELKNLGPVQWEERWTLILFAGAALLWIVRGGINKLLHLTLDDTSIAILIGVLFFMIPTRGGEGKRLLEWKDTSKLPWGVLLLFGGGLCIASALESTGILTRFAEAIAHLDGGNMLLVTLILMTVMVVLTELMSNTALATIFLPIIASIGVSMGVAPEMFAAPMILATSCVFSLPMGTPPNAVIFASGEIRISNMIRVGAIMDPISILLLTFIAHYLAVLFL
ncbi:MAG: SLC13 family permease [Marinifilaceae bacterium]